MYITQKEYAEKYSLNFATVRAAVGRGCIQHVKDASGKRLVDENDPWWRTAKKNAKYRGISYSRIYNIHRTMKSRCSNPKLPCYKNYGGRGISVCEEWKKSFVPFYEWAMANGYRDDLQIDRIDNDGNYEPSNCRWVTPKENARNRRPPKRNGHPHPPFFSPLDVPVCIKCDFEDDCFVSFHDVGGKILKRSRNDETGISTWSTATESDFEKFFQKK